MNRIRPGAAFSLLELLVALAVTLALAGTALLVTINVLALWRRVQDGFSSAAQIRIVDDFLERDFHGALARNNSGSWLAVEVQDSPATLRDVHGWLVDAPDRGCVKPATAVSLNAVPVEGSSGTGASIGRARFGMSGVWLRLFSVGHDGLPAAVAYQLLRRPVSGAVSTANPVAPRYLLVRTSSTDVLSRGPDVSAGYDDILVSPDVTDVLAENVVDFGVWLYVRSATSPDGLEQVFPTDASDTEIYLAPDESSGAFAGQSPAVADVMVRILTDEGAALLANLESGKGRTQAATDAEWWSLVEAHSTVAVRRFELKGVAP